MVCVGRTGNSHCYCIYSFWREKHCTWSKEKIFLLPYNLDMLDYMIIINILKFECLKLSELREIFVLVPLFFPHSAQFHGLLWSSIQSKAGQHFFSQAHSPLLN